MQSMIYLCLLNKYVIRREWRRRKQNLLDSSSSKISSGAPLFFRVADDFSYFGFLYLIVLAREDELDAVW